METSRVRIESVAKGGDGVTHLGSGQVLFVPGALVGDTCDIEIITNKKRFARGRLVTVVEASPHRIEPKCEHVSHGCGGCDWAHASHSAQLNFKQQIVVDALERIAKIDVPNITWAEGLPIEGYRTQFRAAVVDGRARLRQAKSHDTVPLGGCLVAHPLVRDLVENCHFGTSAQVSLRVGANTGDRLVVVDVGADEHRDFSVPDDVVVATFSPKDQQASHKKLKPNAHRRGLGLNPWPIYREKISGTIFDISAESFFQSRTDGAEVLCAEVASAVGSLEQTDVLIDLCGGVGLFGATIDAHNVVSVERSESSCRDAETNLVRAAKHARIDCASFESWEPTTGSVVIADPPRSGLGERGVSVVSNTNTERVVLVSCDAASGARDLSLLAHEGFTVESIRLIDMFPQTSHCEMVSLLTR